MSDPLSITASVITVLELAATATNYLRGIRNGDTDRVNLRDELRSTTCLVEMLRDRIEDAEDAATTSGPSRPLYIKALSGPDKPLVQFQRILEDIIKQLSPQSKLRQRSLPMTWPFTKKDIAEKLSCLERLKSHFILVLQNDLAQLTQASYELAQASHERIVDMGQKVAETHLKDHEDEIQRIILWFSTLSFREQHIAILESVQPGTGGWFTKHEALRAWLDGKISMLCWRWQNETHASTRSPYTSMVIDILEHDQSSNSLYTYIYCNYNSRKEQTSVALLSSLVQQVLQHPTRETVPPEVLSLYNSHKKYGTRPTLKELTDLLGKLTSTYESLFVVIDALDECTESEENALRFLSTVRSIGSNVRILCSSRFSTTFEAYFVSTKKVEIFARDEDIRMFLDSEISQQPRLSKHVRADPSLRAEIIDSITEDCRGMFLLAKLHLDSLSTKINRKAVRSALRTLPVTLDDTYSEALQRIYDQPADTAALAETVLLWVICARETLTVMQLQHMYATQELTAGMALGDDDLPDADILTGACSGLIAVDRESQAIHAIHYTVHQYFERSHGQRLMAARLSLTKVSLAYLGLPNFLSGFCESDAAMLQRLTKYPFLEYAAKHWGSDMNLLEADEVLPSLDQLFSNPTVIEMIHQVWSLPTGRYPNWSEEFPRKSPALVLAAAFNLPVVLRHMIANGHKIDDKGTDGETALIRAATFGHTENVRVLLELGAAVNAQDYMGESALQRAARNGHSSVIRVLLDGGACVNSKASNNLTPLMSAVSSGHLDAVRILVEAGAELLVETEWGDSAVSMALRSGQEAIATFLADHGALLPRGQAGRRASIIASRRGLQRLVRRLTVYYEAIAGRPLHRQSSRIVSGLPEIPEIPWERPSYFHTESGERDEVSFAELMEQYDIQTGFHQRYHMMEQIGKGHFATVNLCSNRVTGVLFAVKMFQSHRPPSSSDFESLHYEIQLLRELQKHSHPNLMRMADLFADFEKNRICLVMDLGKEGDLFDLIVAKGKFTETETRVLFTQLLSAIKFLHDRGWVHRDVKPENILVMDKNLTIQLSDFGLAKKLPTDSGSEELASTLCGTPSYVAPEVLQTSRSRSYGFGVDVWSSGVVLYICLSGFPPFSDELYTEENPYTLAQQIKMGQYHYPSPYWDSVGDPALDLIDAMLTVDVDKRATAEECLAHPWMCKESISPDGATDASMALPLDIRMVQLMPKQVLDSEGSALTTGLQPGTI
ncbi:hypothetical protein KXW39_003916 [Aspergillus fumigatus]|nr:hypothetical protein KXX51_004372 [Aspergillus fumigatus]KAH1438876.1 hypothetical protein KXX68_005921 [Aspergillus fumigatus]KAH1528011.1 hypothetical protein KXX18_000742 [Aspergillus fumigatus]KAH1569649.1 hypothetical protein KXX17_001327 [Aspergillus fumigatus]KAH1618713.1 hypothetical protein KXX31_009285 [Aspergillus fumigatus]